MHTLSPGIIPIRIYVYEAVNCYFVLGEQQPEALTLSQWIFVARHILGHIVAEKRQSQVEDSRQIIHPNGTTSVSPRPYLGAAEIYVQPPLPSYPG